MPIKVEDYYPRETFEKMKAFADQHETPFVLIDTKTISQAYDDLRAWRFNPHSHELTPLWEKHAFGCASHMVSYPDSGELVVNDYRRNGEEVVLLNIESGAELARVRSGGLTQGVVFPSSGWNRDLYWSSMGRLARVFVQ